jgi:hypothetical protein
VAQPYLSTPSHPPLSNHYLAFTSPATTMIIICSQLLWPHHHSYVFIIILSVPLSPLPTIVIHSLFYHQPLAIITIHSHYHPYVIAVVSLIYCIHPLSPVLTPCLLSWETSAKAPTTHECLTFSSTFPHQIWALIYSEWYLAFVGMLLDTLLPLLPLLHSSKVISSSADINTSCM